MTVGKERLIFMGIYYGTFEGPDAWNKLEGPFKLAKGKMFMIGLTFRSIRRTFP